MKIYPSQCHSLRSIFLISWRGHRTKSEGISLTFALVSSSSLAIASSVGAKTVIAPFVIAIIIVLLIGVSITWPFCHCYPSFIEPFTSWTLEIAVIYSLFNSSSSSSRFSPSSSQSSLSNLVLKAPQPSRGLQGRKGTSWTGWVGEKSHYIGWEAASNCLVIDLLDGNFKG